MKTQLLKSCFFLILFLFSSFLTAAEIPVIAAAASVKIALKEIAEAFYQDTGKTVRISYSSSGNLTRQILQSGPFELFLSANSRYVDQLYQQQMSNDHGVVYALGRLVLLTNNNTTISLDEQLSGIKQALQKNQLHHFAIANPVHAPYGVAAREVLQRQGLWEQIQPHLVLGENAAQATQFATSGAAQVSLTSYSLALAPILQNTTRYLLIPATMHQPLKQTAVLLKNAGNTCKLFFNYLQQEKARQILTQYGYTKP